MDCQEKVHIEVLFWKKILPKTFKSLFKVDVCEEMQ